MAYRRDVKDNGYKSVFTNSWLVRQRNRSWIKGLGKNPQKSELIHWRQCLLSGATEPCPLGLRENTCVYTCHPAQCHGHVWPCWHGSRQNSQKNGMGVKTSADANWLIKIYVGLFNTCNLNGYISWFHGWHSHNWNYFLKHSHKRWCSNIMYKQEKLSFQMKTRASNAFMHCIPVPVTNPKGGSQNNYFIHLNICILKMPINFRYAFINKSMFFS